jgi:CRP/FNR family transcriptional regulator, cyclic AMP receptor protein
MSTGALGREYEGGEVIVQEGEEGNCMYVIQEGEVEVVSVSGDKIVRLAVLGEGDFFGEMAIFEREVRAATVRTLGPTRLITIDKKTFLRRIEQDPSLAFRMVETLSQRIRHMDEELVELSNKNA